MLHALSFFSVLLFLTIRVSFSFMPFNAVPLSPILLTKSIKLLFLVILANITSYYY